MILDPFAGPGGWSEGLRSLGLADLGIEWDADAWQRHGYEAQFIRSPAPGWPRPAGTTSCPARVLARLWRRARPATISASPRRWLACKARRRDPRGDRGGARVLR